MFRVEFEAHIVAARERNGRNGAGASAGALAAQGAPDA
jgi:hypothetical protein